MSDPVQSDLGIRFTGEPAAQAPSPPSGFRAPKSWVELLKKGGKVHEYSDRTGEWELVRQYELEVRVYFRLQWEPVRYVGYQVTSKKRADRETREYFCILLDEPKTYLPVTQLGSFAVREIELPLQSDP